MRWMLLGMWAGLAGCAQQDTVPPTGTAQPKTATDSGDTGLAALSCPSAMSLSVTDLSPSGCAKAHASTPCANHRLWEPAKITRPELVVILPGTGMEPDKHDHIAQMAASVGYRALALSYDTSANINDFCKPTGDLTCHGSVRDVVLAGGAHTVGKQTYSVRAARAVVPRLLDVLNSEAWGGDHLLSTPTSASDFDAIDWSSLILVGFSMGAGQAGRLAQRRAVQGVLMIDGAKDPVMVGKVREYAEWTQDTTATEGCRLFGAYHADGNETSELVGQWLNLGMVDEDVDADTLPFVLGDAHQIYTAQEPASGATDHLSMARDGDMPDAATGGASPALASDIHLFEPYTQVLCTIGEIESCE